MACVVATPTPSRRATIKSSGVSMSQRSPGHAPVSSIAPDGHDAERNLRRTADRAPLRGRTTLMCRSRAGLPRNCEGTCGRPRSLRPAPAVEVRVDRLAAQRMGVSSRIAASAAVIALFSGL